MGAGRGIHGDEMSACPNQHSRGSPQCASPSRLPCAFRIRLLPSASPPSSSFPTSSPACPHAEHERQSRAHHGSQQPAPLLQPTPSPVLPQPPTGCIGGSWLPPSQHTKVPQRLARSTEQCACRARCERACFQRIATKDAHAALSRSARRLCFWGRSGAHLGAFRPAAHAQACGIFPALQACL